MAHVRDILSQPIIITPFFDESPHLIIAPRDKKMLDIIIDRTVFTGKKFVPASGEWPEPADAVAHPYRIMEVMAERAECEEGHPGWSIPGPNKKSQRNIEYGCMEEGAMEVDTSAAHGAAPDILEPKINIGEQRKENPEDNPLGGDDFFKENSYQKGREETEFNIEKHGLNKTKSGLV